MTGRHFTEKPSLMHFHRYSILLVLFFLSLAQVSAQEFPPEDICVPFGSGLIANVVEDNATPGTDFTLSTSFYQDSCFFIDDRGNLYFNQGATPESCCGPHEPIFVEVFREFADGEQEFIGVQEVNITIKCLKPDCGLVDLEEYVTPPQDPTNEMPEPVPCIPACENSTATYLFNQDAGLAYDWMVVNGTVNFDPALPGQVTISWGPLGAASISVDIYDANGDLLETRVWCVELTPAPVAGFSAPADACLNQDVYFTNTSSGAPATYDWDFGDGNTAQNVTNPTHAYTTAGTYTVTMIATSTGVNPDGSDGCCCTDSISYDIEIDPLPGPGIFWVSTLCEDDASKYWTDATGCNSIAWSVSGNGTITGGQGSDTVMVQWGAGPSGTITLDVSGCDIPYCPSPSTAVVPIISSNGSISGPVAVCKNETVSYELPKWMTVTYNWSVSDPSIIINGDNDGNIISVTWPSVPGTYEIYADYGSDFLNGLPNHSESDCFGSATLSVTVLGDFTISATPNPACDGNSVFVQGFSDIGPTAYNWTVTGQSGLSTSGPTANILFPGPGVYGLTAEVVNPADYCVDTRSITVVVKDAVNPVIVGPSDYCVGESVVYSILSPTPGYNYNWTPTGGTVVTGNGGPTVEVIFTTTLGASLSVVGVDGAAPFCSSDPAVVNPVTKTFVGSPAIVGPSPCTNSQASYGIDIAQHADVTYTWSVTPETAGSVVDNIDTPNPTINWNNDGGPVTVQLVMELCGQTLTLTENFSLSVPEAPVIVQVGELCPSGSAMLEIDGSLFSSISWNTGATTPSITITSPGNYIVNTIDLNGCPGVDRYRVVEVDGPSVNLRINGNNAICVNDPPYPANPVFTAGTGAANTIEWFCNGDSQGAAATGNNTFIHVWNDTIKTYAYTVLVTDPNGCTTTPDPIFVYQRPCCDTPYVTTPLPMGHTFMALPQSPDCDIVDLTATFPATGVDCHGWDLPRHTGIISGGGDTTATTITENLTIQLPGVGCYKLESEIFNWAYDYDTTTVTDPFTGVQSQVITIEDSIKCGEALLLTVCNPLKAEFDYSEDCGKVTFINQSQIDPALTTGTVNYTWDFGDGLGSSTLENPMYTYATNGTYTVTLVVSDNDCQSTFTYSVTVENLPDSDYTFSPNPACYGQPVTFTGTGTDVIEWKWDFGDGAVFVGNNPQKTFLPAGGSGTATITLTTENGGGCRDTVIQTITINPVPDTFDITATPDLIICEGETTTLSVPSAAGNTYLWTNGATNNSITVGTAGMYGLTITSADGCTTVIDPVEVQVIPLPDASWFGNPFICDTGSTTLTASAGGGHTYEWFNVTTGTTVNTREYTVNYLFGPPEQDIILTVTNSFGCKSQSAITVKQVDSPAPVVAITGGDCEGDGSTITVTNPEPGVVYTWNTGETGLSIFTFQSGAYTVLATDPVSGCTGSATAVVNPLPDLCIVPVGCYESCDPDTLYAPLGNYTYEWFDENGSLGDFDDSTVVSVSGVYHVVVTDIATGCFSTSDPLYLEVIDCDSTVVDCDDLVTRINPTNPDEVDGACCYDLTYANLPSGVYFIRVSSPNAELTASGINPALGYFGTPDAFTLEFAVDATLTTQLPAAMAAPAVATICPQEFLSSPQVLLIEYLDETGQVVCEDKLETFCEPEPDCVYVTSDTLTCDDEGLLTLSLTVCAPSDLDFTVGHLQLVDITNSTTINLPVSPALGPGDCQVFTLTIGALPPGSDFCYQLIAHTADPEVDPAALCCSEGEERCLVVPDCDPCDDLITEGVVKVEGDDCCYDIYLYDGTPAYDFDQIDLCLISGDATLSVNNQLGNALTGVINSTGTSVSVFPVGGGILPDGAVFQLPTICLNDGSVTDYQLEIKWMNEGNVECRDTVTVFCAPDCGYLEEELVECKNDRYVWTGQIVNTSNYPAGEAYIKFPAGSGLSPYNTTIVFPTALNPGDSAPVQIEIGNPAGPGDTICFTVILHEVADSDLHLNCCEFEACIILPDCPITKCDCEQVRDLVGLGIDTLQIGPGSRDYLLQTVAVFSHCDSIRWRVRRLSPNSPWEIIGAGYEMPFSFSEDWLYQVQITVYRTDENGTPCPPRSATKRFDFRQGSVPVNPGQVPDLEVFPNPTTNFVDLVSLGGNNANVNGRLDLIDTNGKRVVSLPPTGAESDSRRINLRNLAPGVYLLRGEGADGAWVKRIVKQ